MTLPQLNVSDISLTELKIDAKRRQVLDLMFLQDDFDEPAEDYRYLLVLDPPTIMMSADKDWNQEVKEPGGEYSRNGKTLLQSLKKEFHDFICTDSDHYEKERESIGGNMNLLIVGVASAIAAKLSLEIGIVTSFVAAAIIALCKVGKRALCQSFGSEG